MGALLIDLPFYEKGLALHDSRLAFYLSPRSIEQPQLHRANNDQQRTKNIHSPIWLYRHRGKFGDAYVALLILGILIASGGVMGLTCVSNSRRFRRIGFLSVGLLLDAVTCGSTAIGCLPWDWWTCLYDGQQHNKREELHGDKLYRKAVNFKLGHYRLPE